MEHDNLLDSPPKSHGRRIIERIKANHLSPTQFRLGGLLAAMLFLSVVLSIARASPAGVPGFFIGLYLLCYAFAPLLAYAVFLHFARVSARRRRLLTAATAAVIALPVWMWVAWERDINDATLIACWTFVWLWLPECLCLLGIWLLLFRRSRRRLDRLPEEFPGMGEPASADGGREARATANPSAADRGDAWR